MDQPTLHYKLDPTTATDMSQRILVVEDDERIVRMLRRFLEGRGYTVHSTTELSLLPVIIEEFIPDLVVLDWMLPERPGIEVLRQLRKDQRFLRLPVIMVTARGDEIDRVDGLLTGADDYIVKPFGLAELEARILSVLRRATRQGAHYHDEYLDLDPEAKRCIVNGKAQTLTFQEWAVLSKLLENPMGVTREQLVQAVWGSTPPSSIRSIDNVVMRLRKVIEPEDSQRYILTERGSGYRFHRNTELG